MKAVISKNQFDRIKNFINETKEIKKDEVLGEKKKLTKKQLRTFDVDNDGDIEADDMSDLRNMKKITKEELKGNQKRLDKNKNNKIDSDDFKLLRKEKPINEQKRNIKQVVLTLDETGLKHFKTTPTFKDLLNPQQLAELKTGNNKLSVNHYVYSALKRVVGYMRNHMSVSDSLDEGSDCGCGSDKDDTRYMFFSNLEQMMRQARMLLQMDEDMLEDLLNNGHDWAADHIAEAKNNMDQVFDFIMGEMNGEGEDDSWDNEEEDEREMVYEGMRLKKKAFVSRELKNHLDNNIPLYESEFKYGSEKHIELLKEVKELYNKGIISLNETDEFMVNEFDPKPVKVKNVGEIYLGLIQEDYESDEELLSEAVYQGRKVQLGKRMAGDVKKFKVYVRNEKGNVVKVNFGQKGVKIKKNNPARRKSFRARHNCTNPGPRWKARYWSCRAW
jgi:hypothetical protein